MYSGSLPAVSNRQGWQFQVEIKDAETGDLIDLSTASIELDICEFDTNNARLSSSISNAKVTVLALGVFQAEFTQADMRTLCSGTYSVGCTISNEDSEPQQFIVASLPVLDGAVT